MAVQYRYVIVYLHAGKELHISYGDTWYESLEECMAAFSDLEFDFCCGYDVIYEARLVDRRLVEASSLLIGRDIHRLPI